MLEQIILKTHANIRLIGQEEVAVELLQEDIVESRPLVTQEQAGIRKIRYWLDQPLAVFTVADRSLSRQQLRDELARRFDRFKETQIVLAGK